MKISSISAPKDRTARVPSDDTVLIMPQILAIFDGATWPQKSVSVKSSGALASQAAAQAVAMLSLSEDLLSLPAPQILAAISTQIRTQTLRLGMEGKPSTTMALAVLGDDMIRFLCVGDSPIRVNGTQILVHEKPIDAVSTHNRLAVYATLLQRYDDVDAVEQHTRIATFDGHHAAVAHGILTAQEVEAIHDTLCARFDALTHPDDLRWFLNAGIREQHNFANCTDHPMGFSTLNEDPTSLTDIIDKRMARAEVDSIEIFSDGYFAHPTHVDLAAWEDAFTKTEAEDFHKLHRFANVKGSTRDEFADDRAIIVAQNLSMALT